MPSGSSTRRTSCHSVAPSMRGGFQGSRAGCPLKCEYSIQTMMGRLDSEHDDQRELRVEQVALCAST